MRKCTYFNGILGHCPQKIALVRAFKLNSIFSAKESQKRKSANKQRFYPFEVPETSSHLKEFEIQVDEDTKEKKPYQIEKFTIFDAPFHF